MVFFAGPACTVDKVAAMSQLSSKGVDTLLIALFVALAVVEPPADVLGPDELPLLDRLVSHLRREQGHPLALPHGPHMSKFICGEERLAVLPIQSISPQYVINKLCKYLSFPCNSL